MNKQEVKGIVNDEIRKYINDSLDKEIKSILKKSNSAARGEIVSIIKDAMESVYKVLWQKRTFWKSDIK